MIDAFSELRADIADFSAHYDVSSSIHPDDFIFRFVIGSLGHPKLPTLRDCVRYYFEDGNKSAAAFADLLKRHSAPSRPDVLEFASGYGCVSRHLAKMTEINCSASD